MTMSTCVAAGLQTTPTRPHTIVDCRGHIYLFHSNFCAGTVLVVSAQGRAAVVSVPPPSIKYVEVFK